MFSCSTLIGVLTIGVINGVMGTLEITKNHTICGTFRNNVKLVVGGPADMTCQFNTSRTGSIGTCKTEVETPNVLCVELISLCPGEPCQPDVNSEMIFSNSKTPDTNGIYTYMAMNNTADDIMYVYMYTNTLDTTAEFTLFEYDANDEDKLRLNMTQSYIKKLYSSFF